MPTEKPRITITLTERQHAILRDMSKQTGESMSSVVVELLDTALPTLERVVAAIRAASKASEEAKKGLSDSFDKAEKDIFPGLLKGVEQLNLLLAAAAGSAERKDEHAQSRSRKTGSDVSGPPPTNRGVRIPPLKPNKANTSAASQAVRKGRKK